MGQINLSSEEIVEVFKKYCESNNFLIEAKKDPSDDWRLDISNIREKTLVIIYHTGTVVIGGKKNDLRTEFEKLKVKFTANPKQFVSCDVKEIMACATRYEIVTCDIREKIKEDLIVLDGIVEIADKPNSAIEYRAKITRDRSSLTITQYGTGTLLLQGKTDKLFDDGCTWIEKVANPAAKDVIARFISSDEKHLEYFVAKYTPQLLEMAEKRVREALGNVYKYLETHDQKWCVASECLCLSEIPLPEFSPLVMPASKAFEGFAKKLLVDVGLFDTEYLKTKSANFSALSDSNNPKRKGICTKEKYADTFLKRLNVCLDANRNFMMHSDSSNVTKVNSVDEAKEKVETIFKDTREIFEYFSNHYGLTCS